MTVTPPTGLQKWYPLPIPSPKQMAIRSLRVQHPVYTSAPQSPQSSPCCGRLFRQLAAPRQFCFRCKVSSSLERWKSDLSKSFSCESSNSECVWLSFGPFIAEQKSFGTWRRDGSTIPYTNLVGLRTYRPTRKVETTENLFKGTPSLQELAGHPCFWVKGWFGLLSLLFWICWPIPVICEESG